MPSIIIKEKDKTGAEAVQYDDYTALIPGKAASETEYNVTFNGETFTVKENAEFLFETYSALKAIIGNGKDLDSTHVSYHMAKRLLNLGIKVLFVVRTSLSANAESGSVSFFEKFKDRSLYDLRFITAGEFEIDADLANEMVDCAAKRGDAVALIDVPMAGEESGSVKTALEIRSWLDGLSNTPFTVGDIVETPLKYAAGFAGHFTINTERIAEAGSESGSVEYKKALYPASFDYLSCFANYVHSYSDWFAMAGSVRGKSPFGDITVVDGIFGEAEIALLQTRELINETGHCSCNVIANIRPYGNVVWGNRTLHPITLDAETNTAGLRASNFLNVRQLCSDVKKTVYRACRRFTFEPNTDTLWVRFCNEITPLLEKMKSDQGLRGYKLIQEQTSKKATLKAVIRIIPVEAVEDFDITIELSDSIEISE